MSLGVSNTKKTQPLEKFRITEFVQEFQVKMILFIFCKFSRISELTNKPVFAGQ